MYMFKCMDTYMLCVWTLSVHVSIWILYMVYGYYVFKCMDTVHGVWILYMLVYGHAVHVYTESMLEC